MIQGLLGGYCNTGWKGLGLVRGRGDRGLPLKAYKSFVERRRPRLALLPRFGEGPPRGWRTQRGQTGARKGVASLGRRRKPRKLCHDPRGRRNSCGLPWHAPPRRCARFVSTSPTGNASLVFVIQRPVNNQPACLVCGTTLVALILSRSDRIFLRRNATEACDVNKLSRERKPFSRTFFKNNLQFS